VFFDLQLLMHSTKEKEKKRKKKRNEMKEKNEKNKRGHKRKWINPHEMMMT
jgi:hypothetical protein